MKVCKGLSIGTKYILVRRGDILVDDKSTTNSIEYPASGVRISTIEL